jgi:hypothetical protein
VLLAQQWGLQAFCTGALERMHERAAKLTGAVNNTAVIASETMILLNTSFRISTNQTSRREKRSALAGNTQMARP